MSPRTRIITLNLGSQSLELAEFRLQPEGGLALAGYRSRELLIEPGSDAPGQLGMSAALREMLDEQCIKKGEVYYTVAEDAVFTRFVKLPALGDEKIERIIAFEAQQNVPFPIDEVVWDYQVVGGGGDEQIQVILVAIKADLIEDINATVEGTGLRTSIVELAPMALANAFRHNYGDPGGCSLLVDIGARTTNLLFFEPGKIFIRSVAIGGGSVTSAIAREFKEPFASAEFRKKRDGSLGPGALDLQDSDPGRVCRILLATMTRLQAEVTRSIGHYCTQQQGNSPERVFLSGGGASVPSIREFFGEKLRLPTEIFDRLRKVAVVGIPDLAEISRLSHLLGEPVGLALRAASECALKLNLCPPSVVRRKAMAKRRPFLFAAVACLLFSLLGWGVYYTRLAQVARHNATGVEEKIAVMRRIESQISERRKQMAALDLESAPLVEAIKAQSFWLHTIEELNARLPPEDIWITELVGTSGGKPFGPIRGPTPPAALDSAATPPPAPHGAKDATPPAIDGVLVRGLYLFNPRQQEVVMDYFRNLSGSSWFAIDPNNQAKVLRPTTPTNTEWAFPYELRLELRAPVRLP